METLKHVLGPLASKMESEMLLDNGRMKSLSAASPETVFLRGKRICWASETGRGNWFSSERVKQLCGTRSPDEICGRKTTRDLRRLTQLS